MAGMPSCAIVHHKTPGMAADAALLAGAIKASSPRARIATWELPGRFARDYATPIEIGPDLPVQPPFDFVFLLEHAHANPPLLEPAFARHIVYVPNVEWLSPLDEQVIASGAIDTVLLKTHHSAAVFSAIQGAGRVKNGVVYTGWTSADVGQPTEGERRWDQCLNVCGRSKQKNADVIVPIWMKNPDLPTMTIVAAASTPVDLKIPLRASDNLHVHVNKLPEPELRALQRRSGIHVCPSIAEGFGHTLNEARAAAALLITTHGPPMNELVEDGSSGILVPVRPENQERFHLAPGFRVTAEDLEQSVRRALALTPDQRRQMGLHARKLYEDGRERFHSSIRRFIGV